MIRVIIAEDHHLVRQGICALLEQSGTVQVVAEAATGEEAVQLTETHKPDVVVMDLSMPRLDGVQASERILEMDLPTQIIILSMHADTTMVQQLLRRGVKGYLLKDAVTEELLLAIQSVSQGKLFLSPTLSDSVMSLLLAPPDAQAESMADLLTPREREVLQLVAEGHTNGGIAEILGISVKTVEKHRANVMSKLEVKDLASLVREGIKQGLIFLDE
ncbi:MAG: response regulator transcription factor [Candidatus Promineifilaceae bacterium]|nr:response regulator transcription factor [Anaerolineaceae bacterium]